MPITLNKIQDDLKTAMKAGEKEKLSTLRMLVSAIRNKQIEVKNRDEAGEDLIIQVLKSEVKKRKDSATTYRDGGRPELAEKEEAETRILEEYLPEQMSEDDIKKIVMDIVGTEQCSVRTNNFGAIMGQVMAKTKGKADGTVVSRIVKESLS